MTLIFGSWAIPARPSQNPKWYLKTHCPSEQGRSICLRWTSMYHVEGSEGTEYERHIPTSIRGQMALRQKVTGTATPTEIPELISLQHFLPALWWPKKAGFCFPSPPCLSQGCGKLQCLAQRTCATSNSLIITATFWRPSPAVILSEELMETNLPQILSSQEIVCVSISNFK